MADDLTTLNARLAEAEAAQHSLATGTRVADVWKDGRRIRYQAANRADLDAYVTDLRCRIDALSAPTAGTRPRRRFIPVSFG